MSPHHSGRMSQRSQDSGVALCLFCSGHQDVTKIGWRQMKHCTGLCHIYSVRHNMMRLRPKGLWNILLSGIIVGWWRLLENNSFPRLPVGFYTPRLDHIKIISNHHAITCELPHGALESLQRNQSHVRDISTTQADWVYRDAIPCQWLFQPYKENIFKFFKSHTNMR